ncbi:MAG: YeeE/YedE family protein [Gammaproteobacteria bacterium]|nr:YeeE/YedE family protein [Gammaproteobacteria bacterium]
MVKHLLYGIFGLAFGYSLSRIGFSDYGEVHRMFVFADLRLLLTFASAVVLSAVVFAFLSAERKRQLQSKHIHPGTIPGGLLFGLGWAITGACPSIGLVQLGEGQLAAAWTILGILAGAGAYRRVHARFFGWDTGACET